MIQTSNQRRNAILDELRRLNQPLPSNAAPAATSPTQSAATATATAAATAAAAATTSTNAATVTTTTTTTTTTTSTTTSTTSTTPTSDDRSEFIERLTQLKAAAESIEASARALELEHGVAIGLELFSSCELAQLDLQYEYRLLGELLANDDAARNDLFERYAALVKKLNEAARVFNRFADRAMLERVLQTLANIYMRTAWYASTKLSEMNGFVFFL